MLDAVATLGDAAAVVGGDVAQEVQHLINGAVADGVDGQLRASGHGIGLCLLQYWRQLNHSQLLRDSFIAKVDNARDHNAKGAR